MEKRYSIAVALLMCVLTGGRLSAQTGGREVFPFLQASPGARVAALGGMPVSWRAGDPGAAFLNPSLLTSDMSGSLQFSSTSYFADVRFGHFSYVHAIDSNRYTLMAGVHYARYGDIPRTDVYDVQSGQFRASDADFYLSASRAFRERIIVGAGIHYIHSTLDAHQSQGLAFSAGVSYANPERHYGLSLVLRNAGFQLSPYHQLREALPLEVQLGFSKKLKHLPLIYHLGFRHIERWNLRYDDPDLSDGDLLFGEEEEPGAFDRTLSNLMRHLVLGVELNIGKRENFSLRLGYNHLRNRDLSVADYRSLSGLSGGFGIRIYKFRFEYAYSGYHIAGGSSQISIRTNLQQLFGRDM
jgi:hypothetical protein